MMRALLDQTLNELREAIPVGKPVAAPGREPARDARTHAAGRVSNAG